MGTIAHEWIMAIGATYGYKGSNGRAMDMWEEGECLCSRVLLLKRVVYPRGRIQEPPLTMLTDTFTAKVFFADFVADPERALRWGSLRQDSGDPFAFVKEAKDAWAEVEKRAGKESGDGVVAKGKRVIFSDGLNLESAIELQKGCDEIGIGGELRFPGKWIYKLTFGNSVIWNRYIPHKRFRQGIGSVANLQTAQYGY